MPRRNHRWLLPEAHGRLGERWRQGSLARLMGEIEIARITAARHADRILSFEEWQLRNKAA
jgi:hypothetical protein